VTSLTAFGPPILLAGRAGLWIADAIDADDGAPMPAVIQATPSNAYALLALPAFDSPHVTKAAFLLAEVSILVRAASGHAALPEVMPRLSVATMDLGSWEKTHIVGTDDASSIAKFESPHTLKLSNLKLPVGVRAWVALRGESGANALPGFTVAEVRATYSF